MITANPTRPAILRIFDLIGLRCHTKVQRGGPIPSWINDPQMARQLLNDTGLKADDFGSRQSNNDTTQFGVQPGQW